MYVPKELRSILLAVLIPAFAVAAFTLHLGWLVVIPMIATCVSVAIGVYIHRTRGASPADAIEQMLAAIALIWLGAALFAAEFTQTYSKTVIVCGASGSIRPNTAVYITGRDWATYWFSPKQVADGMVDGLWEDSVFVAKYHNPVSSWMTGHYSVVDVKRLPDSNEQFIRLGGCFG